MNYEEAYKQLKGLIGIDAMLLLCEWVGRKTRHGKKCDDTYQHTRFWLSQNLPTINQVEVEQLLHELGCNCDCEVGFNLCARIPELER